jgi:hypothetical protein
MSTHRYDGADVGKFLRWLIKRPVPATLNKWVTIHISHPWMISATVEVVPYMSSDRGDVIHIAYYDKALELSGFPVQDLYWYEGKENRGAREITYVEYIGNVPEFK